MFKHEWHRSFFVLSAATRKMTFPCQRKAKTNVKDLSYINLKTAVEEGGRSFICDFVQGKLLLSGP